MIEYIAIASPSGGGKTELVKMLVADKSFGDYVKIITHTTRPKRYDEEHGKDYYFVSDDAFDKLVAQGNFIEYSTIYQYKYGISQKSIEHAEKRAKDGVVIIVDIKGAEKIKEFFPDITTVFILPPDEKVLAKRLQKRGTETPENLKKRLDAAHSEIAAYREFDFLVVNRTLKQAYSDLKLIITFAKTN